VHGIKTAAAIWITGAIGLAIGTAAWWLGVIAGAVTALILFVTDMMGGEQRQEEAKAAQAEARSS
jgi:putative Mg2+ transporter-C (MgtC) family protein